MKLATGGVLLWVWVSLGALAQELSTGAGHRVGASRPVVGAIRWDAWYGEGSPVSEVEKTLGPKKYHHRLPFFAQVISPSKVAINGDAQVVIEQEITFAADAGLDYWAFVDYWDQGNLGIALRRYREAHDKKGIRYCLIEEGRRLDHVGTPGWPRLAAHFQDPNYLQVLGGRPLLFVYGLPETLSRIDAVTATPAQLARHLREAIAWTQHNRELNPANAVIVYAWNENDEGGWLTPTLQPDGGVDRTRVDTLSKVLRCPTGVSVDANALQRR